MLFYSHANFHGSRLSRTEMNLGGGLSQPFPRLPRASSSSSSSFIYLFILCIGFKTKQEIAKLQLIEAYFIQLKDQGKK